jgi:putative transposase
LVLEQSKLSPRGLAVRFTEEQGQFVSEGRVYRLLKAHDLITSPAYAAIKVENEFHTKTARPNQMRQTDYTYFKIIGWGQMYLSNVLDHYARYIIAWKLCSAMCAEAPPTRWTRRWRHQAAVRPMFTTNPGYPATMALAMSPPSWPTISMPSHEPCPGRSNASLDPGQDRALAPNHEERILLENYFLPGDLEAEIGAFVEHYNRRRCHESLDKVMPSDAYFGRAAAIIKRRELIKRQTIQHRRITSTHRRSRYSANPRSKLSQMI